jgi:hypothetical protein
MIKRSRTILTRNLTVEIIKGTSGLSRALVLVETAVSMADDRAENAEIRMYVRDAARTSTGTNPLANCLAAPTNATDIISPRILWKIIKVEERLYLAEIDLFALSPMINQDARGRPSLRTSATTPI